MEGIRLEDFTAVQNYFSDKYIKSAILAFRVRCLMVKDIPGNFKEKYKKKGVDALICSYCEEKEIMTQTHCLTCSAGEGSTEGLI